MSTQTLTQPSKQSEANKKHYEAFLAKMGELQSPEAVIEYNDIHWTALTGEPQGVDYIEVDAGGVPAMWIVPKDCASDRVIFYSHGGGFVGGSIYTHRKLVGHVAKAVGSRALSFDVSYAHQHKWPRQLDEAFGAYRWLLAQGIQPRHLVVAGDSVGALLTFGVLQKGRDQALPMPAAAMVLSGWMDLTQSGPSYETNRAKDPAFSKEGVSWLASNLLGESSATSASPLFANLSGLPPIYLQAGADETLVDDSRRLADRARESGVEVRLDVFPHMLHTFQMMAGRAPEADEAIRQLAEWVRPKLGLKA